jgi:nucleotide-binding universal stress UspA family protein
MKHRAVNRHIKKTISRFLNNKITFRNDCRIKFTIMQQQNIILVPFDFSNEAENALQFAIDISHTLGSGIMLFYASDGDTLSASQKLSVKIKNLQTLYSEDRRFSYHVSPRMFSSLTMRELDIPGVSYVVIGTRGEHAPLTDKMFGTHATEIIDDGKWPTFVVPAGAKSKPIKAIAVASDYRLLESELPEVLTFAKQFNAGVCVFHISPHEEPAGTEFVIERIVEKSKKEQPGVAVVFRSDMARSKSEILSGIKDFMSDSQFDLLVLHHRNLLGVKRFFTPSVSENLVLHLQVPMLIFQREEK